MIIMLVMTINSLELFSHIEIIWVTWFTERSGSVRCVRLPTEDTCIERNSKNHRILLLKKIQKTVFFLLLKKIEEKTGGNNRNLLISAVK